MTALEIGLDVAIGLGTLSWLSRLWRTWRINRCCQRHAAWWRAMQARRRMEG